MAYIVKFGYSPGDWRIETGKVHSTREAAVAEIKELHEKFGTIKQQALPWQAARPYGGCGPYYALRIHKLSSRQAPRRLIADRAIVAKPVLRKRSEAV